MKIHIIGLIGLLIAGLIWGFNYQAEQYTNLYEQMDCSSLLTLLSGDYDLTGLNIFVKNCE